VQTSVTLRQAVIEDVPQINHLRLQVRENILSDPNQVTHELTSDAITRDGRGWVCAQADQIMGFSIALREEPSIWALFIHPDHEQKGLGSTLLEAAESWLFEQGANRIKLCTEPGTRAEAFYLAKGWIAGKMLDNEDKDFTLERPQAGSAGDQPG
jgi:GNAT superfamily N-acetyltransferase